MIEPGPVWEGRSVSVAAVLAALAALRRQQEVAVRTSVLTLVVRLAGGTPADDVLATVHRLGTRHPSRTVVVRPEPGEPGLDARVAVHRVVREGSRLVLDDVVLDARGPVAGHLDSLVDPFVTSDLPVVVWEQAGVPAPDDRLAAMADVVVVDSRRGGLDDVPPLAARRPVVDLAWVRLLPLRERLADLVRTPAFLPCLTITDRALVRGPAAERRLLAGWVADRLGLHGVEVRPGASPAVVLSASGARIEVCEDGDCLRARATIDGGPAAEVALDRPPQDDVALLGTALTRLGRDGVYEAAVAAAPAA